MIVFWGEGQLLFPFHFYFTPFLNYSGSGKSKLTDEIIRNAGKMFESPPKHILYAYSVWQPAFDSLESEMPNIQFHEGLPSKEDLVS